MSLRSISDPSLRRERCAQALRVGRLVLAALFALILPTACDNVACVFGPGNCTTHGGTSPGIGSNPASVPVNGEWIASVAPKLVSFFPNGTGIAKSSPIVMVFNESLAPTNITAAFELQVGALAPIALNNVVLIGDGRVVVALPSTLIADTVYTVLLRESAVLTDRAGRAFVPASNRSVGTFTTAATDPVLPKVVTSWPPTGALDQSATTDMVVVFDRAMDAATVNSSTFVVTVANNPPPVPTEPTAVMGTLGVDTRVYHYHVVDSQNVPLSLGLNKTVNISLSPIGHPIRDTMNQILPGTPLAFSTAAFSAPTSASITSMPTNAIGINQISGPADLAVKVELDGAVSGDFLGLYLIGTAQGVTVNPPLVALFREVEMTLAPGDDSFTLFAGEIDLLQTSSPLKARLADGTVAFAFQVRRGVVQSPMFVMDVDSSKAGVQSPVLDTVAPVLAGLGTIGNVTGSFVSDLRDVTLIGQSNETLAGALVSTSLGDNARSMGDIPPVTGSGASGLFVAAPVHLGLLGPTNVPLGYTITLYDAAFNASVPATGLFFQLGAIGPGALSPGADVSVDVFDAATLAPIVGASVETHQNDAGVIDPVASAVTDSNGHASLPSAPTLGMETLVTVIQSGYDLFTFDGVRTSRVNVPLSRTVRMPRPDTLVSGTVSTTSNTINLATKNVGDSRAPERSNSLFPVGTCTQDPINNVFNCGYGPSPIRPDRVGAQGALAVIVPANPFQFSPATFLKAYQQSLPLAPTASGEASESSITFTTLLDDPSLDPTELPVEAAPLTTVLTANFPLLVTNESPRIRIEAKTPGIPGSLTVGQGVAYNDSALMLPPETWLIRAAYPGAVETTDNPPTHTLGRLAKQGTVEAPLMLRAELSDTDGNIGGVRARLPLSSATLLPPAAPVLGVPPVFLNPGFLADDLVFKDVIPDAAGEPGIYRVTLTDSAGLSWTIYRIDPPDSRGPDVIAHIPYTGASVALPLAPGPVECQISAFAWPGFDTALFLWTDIEREHDLYSHTSTETIPMLF